MSRPQRYLNRMFLFLIACCGVAFLLFPTLAQAFAVNGPLNSLILGVLAIGILYIFRQVTRLFREVRWVNALPRGTADKVAPPVLLAPMATLLGDRPVGATISTLRYSDESARKSLRSSVGHCACAVAKIATTCA